VCRESVETDSLNRVVESRAPVLPSPGLKPACRSEARCCRLAGLANRNSQDRNRRLNSEIPAQELQVRPKDRLHRLNSPQARNHRLNSGKVAYTSLGALARGRNQAARSNNRQPEVRYILVEWEQVFQLWVQDWDDYSLVEQHLEAVAAIHPPQRQHLPEKPKSTKWQQALRQVLFRQEV